MFPESHWASWSSLSTLSHVCYTLLCPGTRQIPLSVFGAQHSAVDVMGNQMSCCQHIAFIFSLSYAPYSYFCVFLSVQVSDRASHFLKGRRALYQEPRWACYVQADFVNSLPRVPHPCASLLHLSGSLEPGSEKFKDCYVMSLPVLTWKDTKHTCLNRMDPYGISKTKVFKTSAGL